MAREVAALLFAGVFLVAGVAKLADLAGTRRAARELGFAALLGWPIAIGLPFVELALAAGLVLEATSRFAAAAATGLLAAFAVVVVVNLLRGRRPDCGCFGKVYSSRAGFPTAARNAALAIVAALLVVTPAAPVGRFELGAAAVVAAVVGQGVLWLVVLRRYGRALRRIEELAAGRELAALAVGAEAPGFTLRGLDGGGVALSDLLSAGRPVLTAFVDPGCGPCHALLSELDGWRRELSSRLTVAIVSRGDLGANQALVEELGVSSPVLLDDGSVFRDFGVAATPSAVLIAGDGRVLSPLAEGASAIRLLLESDPASSDSPLETSPAIGRRPLAGVATATLGAVVVAPAAHSAGHESTADNPTNPELEAFRKAFEASTAALAKATRDSSRAMRRAAILRGGPAAQAKRAAAAKALEAQRREVLAFRARLERLPATSPDARGVRVSALNGLSLLAQAIRMQAKAVVATPAARPKLLAASERLLLRSADAILTSALQLAGG